MDIDGRGQRHRERMQRKRAAIDRAEKDKGLLLVLTGNGKGKSSSAFGMIARTLGHGMRVGVAQFIKGRDDTGEERFFCRQPGVIWHLLGASFTWETQDPERDTQMARSGWSVVREMLRDESIDLILLDELTYPLRNGWLELGDRPVRRCPALFVSGPAPTRGRRRSPPRWRGSTSPVAVARGSSRRGPIFSTL